MPEPPRMVPLYVARVSDLRVGHTVSLTCGACGHVAELPATILRDRLPLSAFIKSLGWEFRCQQCGHKCAEVDARRALGFCG